MMARATLLCALFFGVLFSLFACTNSTPRDIRVATIDGHSIAYRVLGSGRPAVVIISGLGDGMATFEAVAPEIAETATVIVYDRAGYGASSAAQGVRDAEAAERELSALLEHSNIPGPYVLIGHSVGGLYAEYYAAMHPDQIAGLILEDSRPADFKQRCEAAGVSMCESPAYLAWTMPAGAQAELTALARTTAEVESIPVMTGRPVLVLSRPLPANAGAFDTVWSEAQRDLTTRYPGARQLTASAGGHYIHHDQKDWFVESVRAFLTNGEVE